MKIENQSHKLDGVGRIRTFQFLPILLTTPLLMIQWKLGCWKQKWKNQPIAKPVVERCHWLILSPLLATPTMQFSLDRRDRVISRISVLLLTLSVGFLLDHAALRYWLWLWLQLHHQWKPAFRQLSLTAHSCIPSDHGYSFKVARYSVVKPPKQPSPLSCN